ncbi:hypothetical protein RQP46_010512 [Phenoliferia psychrophenolica]
MSKRAANGSPSKRPPAKRARGVIGAASQADDSARLIASHPAQEHLLGGSTYLSKRSASRNGGGVRSLVDISLHASAAALLEVVQVRQVARDEVVKKYGWDPAKRKAQGNDEDAGELTALGATASLNQRKIVRSTYTSVPFAQPPLGDLRMSIPLAPLNLGPAVIQATARGAECTQQQMTDGFASGIPSSLIDQIEAMPGLESTQSGVEDCLFLNVQYPSNITAGQKLPVLVWIYGGGFEFGSASYDATPLIARKPSERPSLSSAWCLSSSHPVSCNCCSRVLPLQNYRLNAFGFMASKEIEEAGAGNVWLYDQRLALRWIQKYISQFGGDPEKVTLMVAFDGDLTLPHDSSFNPNVTGAQTQLFRGAFMESGAQLPTGANDHGQEYYDIVAAATNCTGPGSLECIRHAPYNQVVAGVDMTPEVLSYQSLQNAWLPRTDGLAIRQDAQLLVEQGKIAPIPVASFNITTDAEALAYIQTNFLLGSTDAEIAEMALHYPQDPTQGSPFNTGYRNQLTPQFKRLAAFAGDYAFQAPRRFFLNKVASLGKNKVWSFIYRRGKDTPFLGSFHVSDAFGEFQTPMIGSEDNQGLDYLINFTVNLDPNSGHNPGINWPEWTPAVPNMLTFLDRPLGGLLGLSITLDTYRQAAMNYVTVLSRKYPM